MIGKVGLMDGGLGISMGCTTASVWEREAQKAYKLEIWAQVTVDWRGEVSAGGRAVRTKSFSYSRETSWIRSKICERVDPCPGSDRCVVACRLVRRAAMVGVIIMSGVASVPSPIPRSRYMMTRGGSGWVSRVCK